jgi:hypothetical protein
MAIFDHNWGVESAISLHLRDTAAMLRAGEDVFISIEIVGGPERNI